MSAETVDRHSWSAVEDTILNTIVTQSSLLGQSISWQNVASRLPGRSNKECRKRWHYRVAHNFKQGPWTSEEDNRLRSAVQTHGTKWVKVSEAVETRSGDQCWKRWHNKLDPQIDHSAWTTDEDSRLLDLVQRMGRNWKEIVNQYFPGRTSLSAKNRHGILIRKLENGTGVRAPASSTSGTGAALVAPVNLNTTQPSGGAHGSAPALFENMDLTSSQMTWSNESEGVEQSNAPQGVLISLDWSQSLEADMFPPPVYTDDGEFSSEQGCWSVDAQSPGESDSGNPLDPAAQTRQISSEKHVVETQPTKPASDTKTIHIELSCLPNCIEDVLQDMTIIVSRMAIKKKVKDFRFSVDL